MKKIQVDAKKQNLEQVLTFVKEELSGIGASAKELRKFHLVVDEIFANIAGYAYDEEGGPVEIIVDYEEPERVFSLVFKDGGKPFDPLSYKEPDISLPAKDRAPGGLGILLVRKTMDEVDYEYRDGKNIVTLKKRMGGEHA